MMDRFRREGRDGGEERSDKCGQQLITVAHCDQNTNKKEDRIYTERGVASVFPAADILFSSSINIIGISATGGGSCLIAHERFQRDLKIML